MNREIERKFIFAPEKWRGRPLRTQNLEQGYLPETGAWEIRLRRSEGDYSYTLKNCKGLDRGEWEISLSPADFEPLWVQTEGLRVSKIRQRFAWKKNHIEVDSYSGKLEGLTVAEVEFESLAQARAFEIPAAFGPELTYDPRFGNRALAEDGVSNPRSFPGQPTSAWSFGALPFRKGPRGWEMVIVSTRRQDRWIFPKGQPEPGLGPEKVAVMEAVEEAGVQGKIVGHPIVLPYVRETGTTNLLLFPMRVSSLADRWLELGQRERQVIPLDRAEAFGEVVRLGAQWIRNFTGTVGL